MAIDGSLDGLYRVTRQAETYYHQVLHPNAAASPDDFPVVIFEGVTHMQFASGTPPSNVAKNDLKPEVSYAQAYTLISDVMSDFLRSQLNSDIKRQTILCLGRSVMFGKTTVLGNKRSTTSIISVES